MDLNKHDIQFSSDIGLSKNNSGHTTLRLDCLRYGGSNCVECRSTRPKPDQWVVPANASDDGCRLVLGLGPTPILYCNDYCPASFNEDKELTALLNQGLSYEGDSIPKLGLPGATEEATGAFVFSVSPQRNLNVPHHSDQASPDDNRVVVPVIDEGSTSAKKSGGYMLSLLLAPRMEYSKILLQTRAIRAWGEIW